MLADIRLVWHHHRLLMLAFLAALVLTVGFALRSMHMMPLAPPPADPPIQGWMTPRLVGHSWHLPPEVMAAALRITPGEQRGRTLDGIARDQGIGLEVLIARIEAAAAVWRAAHPLAEGQDG